MKRLIIKIKTLLIFTIILAGCEFIEDDDTETDTGLVATDVRAVVTTIASDYSAGAFSLITGDNDRLAYNELLPTHSDITVDTFNNDFYVIEKFSGNNISRFSLNDLNAPLWQYSTQDSPTSAVASNPKQIVFLNETKAYILRYGSNTVWIVNPSAASSDNFKIGEIDLSSYADSDGIAEVRMGVIANGHLYIAMQRLVNFAPTETAYVAIIDTATDLEIDAGITGDSLNGIPLTIKNPNTSMQYIAANNSIYIQGIGSYNDGEFIGGIERIDLTDYSTNVIIDDGTSVSHPDEKVSAMAIVSPTLGYYISYIGWGNTSIYQLNPTTGTDTQTTIATLTSGDFSSLAIDGNGLIWVSDVGNATVHIIDPVNDSLVDSVSTGLPPHEIGFVNQ